MKPNQFIIRSAVVIFSLIFSVIGFAQSKSASFVQQTGGWFNDSYHVEGCSGLSTIQQTSRTQFNFYKQGNLPAGHVSKAMGSSFIQLTEENGIGSDSLSVEKTSDENTYLSYKNADDIEIAQGYLKKTRQGFAYHFKKNPQSPQDILSLEKKSSGLKSQFTLRVNQPHLLDERLIIARAAFDSLSSFRKKIIMGGIITTGTGIVAFQLLKNKFSNSKENISPSDSPKDFDEEKGRLPNTKNGKSDLDGMRSSGVKTQETNEFTPLKTMHKIPSPKSQKNSQLSQDENKGDDKDVRANENSLKILHNDKADLIARLQSLKQLYNDPLDNSQLQKQFNQSGLMLKKGLFESIEQSSLSRIEKNELADRLLNMFQLNLLSIKTGDRSHCIKVGLDRPAKLYDTLYYSYYYPSGKHSVDGFKEVNSAFYRNNWDVIHHLDLNSVHLRHQKREKKAEDDASNLAKVAEKKENDDPKNGEEKIEENPVAPYKGPLSSNHFHMISETVSKLLPRSTYFHNEVVQEADILSGKLTSEVQRQFNEENKNVFVAVIHGGAHFGLIAVAGTQTKKEAVIIDSVLIPGATEHMRRSGRFFQMGTQASPGAQEKLAFDLKVRSIKMVLAQQASSEDDCLLYTIGNGVAIGNSKDLRGWKLLNKALTNQSVRSFDDLAHLGQGAQSIDDLLPEDVLEENAASYVHSFRQKLAREIPGYLRKLSQEMGYDVTAEDIFFQE